MEEQIFRYNIRKPIWKINGFGLSTKHMGLTGTIVTCSYKDKEGNLLYPYKYYVSRQEMLSRPTMVSEGETMHVIPFNETTIWTGE